MSPKNHNEKTTTKKPQRKMSSIMYYSKRRLTRMTSMEIMEIFNQEYRRLSEKLLLKRRRRMFLLHTSVRTIEELESQANLLYTKDKLHKFVKTLFSETRKETCPICLEKIKNKKLEDCEDRVEYEDYFTFGVAAPCNHLFCSNCIDEWSKANDSCPLCRCEMKNINMY